MRLLAVIAATTLVTACSLRGTDYLTEGRRGAGGATSASSTSVGMGGMSGGQGGSGGDAAGCPVPLCNGECLDFQDDAENCGRCGETCLGECTQGSCIIYEDASMGRLMGGIATDEQRIYFMATSQGGGRVQKMPLIQGTPSTIIEGIAPSSIFLVGDDLFVNIVGMPSLFARFDKDLSFADLNDALMQVDLFETLAFSTAQGLAQTECWVASMAGQSGLQCMGAMGPGPVQTFAGDPIDFALNAGIAYVVTTESKLWRVEAGAVNAPSELATLTEMANNIALANGRAFLSSESGIWSIALDGSDEMRMTSKDHGFTFEMAIEGKDIYLTGYSMPGRLLHASTDGGEETQLYEAPNSRLGGLALRNEHVYFGAVDAGQMLRRHRRAVVAPSR